MGSSPRGRGKRVRCRRMVWVGRLIPARAGKTLAGCVSGGAGKAHPRAGGENSDATATVALLAGSSPRGRGKPTERVLRSVRHRLIPARAGKTMRSAASASVTPGSSPRGRGKHGDTITRIEKARLIPARAGKTCAGMRSTRRRPAHPRAGGENFCDCMNTRGGFGSSPRGRGKPRESPHRPGAHRLIPARAGKTRAPLLRKAPIAAHPRAGGENTCHRYGPHLIRGSSPRGRGKRRGYVDAGVDLGLIPARAGKT